MERSHLQQDMGAVDPTILSCSPLGYASERWIRMISAVLRAPRDIKTLAAWAREAGSSAGSLRAYCRAVGISAKDSLDFARVLRVVLDGPHRALSPFEALDVADERTMKRLLSVAGIDPVKLTQWPSTADYLARQAYVRNPGILRAVATLCQSL